MYKTNVSACIAAEKSTPPMALSFPTRFEIISMNFFRRNMLDRPSNFWVMSNGFRNKRSLRRQLCVV